MRSRICRTMCLLVCIGLAVPMFAQESHPLTGSWVGYWGPSPDHQNRILVAMDWTGEEITGTINPGSDDLAFRTATLDPSDWSVRIEVDANDPAGNPIVYVIEGRIEDLGSPNRSLVGTWRHGDVSGDFRITLQ